MALSRTTISGTSNMSILGKKTGKVDLSQYISIVQGKPINFDEAIKPFLKWADEDLVGAYNFLCIQGKQTKEEWGTAMIGNITVHFGNKNKEVACNFEKNEYTYKVACACVCGLILSKGLDGSKNVQIPALAHQIGFPEEMKRDAFYCNPGLQFMSSLLKAGDEGNLTEGQICSVCLLVDEVSERKSALRGRKVQGGTTTAFFRHIGKEVDPDGTYMIKLSPNLQSGGRAGARAGKAKQQAKRVIKGLFDSWSEESSFQELENEEEPSAFRLIN
jgi:hypothetical protein